MSDIEGVFDSGRKDYNGHGVGKVALLVTDNRTFPLKREIIHSIPLQLNYNVVALHQLKTHKVTAWSIFLSAWLPPEQKENLQ